MIKKFIFSLLLSFLLAVPMASPLEFHHHSFQERGVKQATAVIPIDALRDAIARYEKWVKTWEDKDSGYKPGEGYPMYLYFFGYMYYELFKMQGDEYYLKRFLRVLD
jgi:hypothetical protein